MKEEKRVKKTRTKKYKNKIMRIKDGEQDRATECWRGCFGFGCE